MFTCVPFTATIKSPILIPPWRAGEGRPTASWVTPTIAAPFVAGTIDETVKMSRTKQTAATMKLIPEPAARTLNEFLALVSRSSFSSISTNAPMGITSSRRTPADFTRIPRLLATMPWEASWKTTAITMASQP